MFGERRLSLSLSFMKIRAIILSESVRSVYCTILPLAIFQLTLCNYSCSL